jgi:hypothetical protein
MLNYSDAIMDSSPFKIIRQIRGDLEPSAYAFFLCVAYRLVWFGAVIIAGQLFEHQLRTERAKRRDVTINHVPQAH